MELSLKASVLSYDEVKNGGVTISMTLTLENKFTFQCIYWIHPSGKKLLEIDDMFLKIFGVKNTDELPFLEDLYKNLDATIPTHQEIFKEMIHDNKKRKV